MTTVLLTTNSSSQLNGDAASLASVEVALGVLACRDAGESNQSTSLYREVDKRELGPHRPLMPSAAAQRCYNVLLGRLDGPGWAAIEPHLDRCPLRNGAVVLEAGGPIETVFFPESGIASVQEVLNDGRQIGVGIVGFEGMVGWSVLLNSPYASQQVAIAIGGSGLYISAARLMQLCGKQTSLREVLLLYVQSFLTQMSNTIVASLNDPVSRRLARWLLMNHDRLSGDEIALTHDQLGIMLAIRRASVTDALHIIEGEHLIRSLRGRIEIRDRAGLIEFAGESYGAAEAEYARQIAPFVRSLAGATT